MLLLIQPSAQPDIPWSLLWTVATVAMAFGVSYLHLYFTERNRKLYAPLHPLYDDRGTSCWATKKDLDAMGAKLNVLHDHMERVDEKTEQSKVEIALIKQAQMYTHQEMMTQLTEAVTTLKGVVIRLDTVSGNQQAHAEQLRIILNRKNEP